MTQLSVDSFDTELSESTRCCVTIEFTCNWNTGDAELNTAGEQNDVDIIVYFKLSEGLGCITLKKVF